MRISSTAADAEGIRLVDVALTTVLVGLAIALAVEDVTDTDATIRLDSHSWWMLPVAVAAAAPVLWWRRSPTAAVLAATAVMAVHVWLFGWVGRCGSGLPLTWVLAYLVGSRDGLRRSLAGLVAAELLGALVLVRDSAAGPSLIPVVAVMSVLIWGIGRVVQHRSVLASQLQSRNEELARLRDATASLDVSSDRARLSAELDALLDARLAQLGEAAEAQHADVAATQARLAGIEADSRDVLEQMREVVGVLRGGEVALTPAPSVASLDALLARHGRRDTRLSVVGDPRALPASVELSAYRVVEHVLGVMTDDPTPVEVGMRFDAAAVEITLAGRVARGADVRAALARARERVRLQQGTLEVKVGRGRARVVAHLPVGI